MKTMKLSTLLLLSVVATVVFAEDEPPEARACGAIVLMNEFESIASIGDVDKARDKLGSADEWYRRCRPDLLPLDREWVDIRAAGAKESLSWPRTIDQAAKEIAGALSESDRALVRAKAREDLIEFHMGWGMGIRNGTGLWRGNHALLESACGSEPCHPDDASMKIIEAVWEHLQAQDAD